MIVLLPCYSLENFSLYRSSEESREIFSAWTALYHPDLIRRIGKMPQWDPAGSPMNERPCSLVIIPPCTEASVPVNWLTRMKEREANHELHLIRKLSDRDEILKTAFEKLEIEPQFNDDIVATFFSLGFCHFLSELLTRKLRYMSNLDTQNFANRTLDAIKALEDKDQFLYEDQIQKAFDLLCQAKEYFFPAPSKLLDLTCVDFEDLEENLPNMLQHRKRREEKTNLVLPEVVLRYCQDKYPAVLRMLQETVKDQQVTIIGDDKNEPPLYLLSQLRIAEQFVASHRYYQQTLGVTPRVFGRYKAGYTYVLPQLLKLCGFIGSLSETYDGWSLSQKSQSLTRWKGNNGSIIPLLSKKTLNAEDNACFMELPDKIGDSYYSDSCTTAIFRHHPDKEAVWLDDILRMNQFSPVLGRVFEMEKYFENTRGNGNIKGYDPDEFKVNFLTRASKEQRSNIVSLYQQFYQIDIKIRFFKSLAVFWKIRSSGRKNSENQIYERHAMSAIQKQIDFYESLDSLIQQLLYENINGIADDEVALQNAKSVYQKFLSEIQTETEKFQQLTEALSHDTKSLIRSGNESDATTTGRSGENAIIDEHGKPLPVGLLILNPAGISQTFLWKGKLKPFSDNQETGVRVRSKTDENGLIDNLITVPAFSQLWLEIDRAGAPSHPVSTTIDYSVSVQKNGSSSGKTGSLFSRIVTKFQKAPKKKPVSTSTLVEFVENRYSKNEVEQYYLLHNDFFELRVDPVTGEMKRLSTFVSGTFGKEEFQRGIFRHPERGNRFAWQLGMKLPKSLAQEDGRSKEHPNFGYSIMKAEHFESDTGSPLCGKLKITGKLISPSGDCVAQYEEILTVKRQSRIIDVEITLTPDILPTGSPWDSYYACRFAWRDSMAEIRSGVHELLGTTDRNYIQAPECVDIRSEPNIGITLLANGLSFYRRNGQYMDMVLIPPNETGRTFRFAVGVDLPRPILSAQEYLTPRPLCFTNIPKPRRKLFSLIQLDSPAILPLSMEFNRPDMSETGSVSTSDTLPGLKNGIRLVLLETEGKPVTTTLKTFQSLSKVESVDFCGKIIKEMELPTHHTVPLVFKRNQILILNLFFKE